MFAFQVHRKHVLCRSGQALGIILPPGLPAHFIFVFRQEVDVYHLCQ